MGKKGSVLVVDDDEIILRAFTRVVKRRGYLTDTAKTGEEALTKLEKNRYDVALIDYRLPDLNGIDLLIKMSKNTQNMVKIIITGSYNSQYRRYAEEKGADAYLEKPIRPETLLRVIAEKLEIKSTRREY